MLAGNRVPDGAEPLAQAYAGHQFGGWVPQLGDGRAILLGELRRDAADAATSSSRAPGPRHSAAWATGGPGWARSCGNTSCREAMHALGIPTTRALAAVTTGEAVLRETALCPARC